ncbi:unnamed protein product [Paramecium octaurelia]|uniref:Uncharacterized protein n=1 Tax=Paramecium octaurelia TaxID=43137 RepID=A0A8S1WQ69_PAROT|nr:unnamed protein product [Paramecium octaurelia]
MSTIIKIYIYIFKKKQKSFDKTFVPQYFQDILNNIDPKMIVFSMSSENLKRILIYTI